MKQRKTPGPKPKAESALRRHGVRVMLTDDEKSLVESSRGDLATSTHVRIAAISNMRSKR